MAQNRKRAEYSFGEYGFKHWTQWVFWRSPSSRERTQWVPLSLIFVCQSELTEFFCRTHRVCRKIQWGSVSSLIRNSTLETVFRYRFPQKHGRPWPHHTPKSLNQKILCRFAFLKERLEVSGRIKHAPSRGHHFVSLSPPFPKGNWPLSGTGNLSLLWEL